MSIRSSRSRSCDSVAPFITLCVTSDTSAGVRPSARALSWSSSTFSVRTGSFQSSCTSRTFGLEATTLLHLAGDLAHHLRVGADDAELHREADRRAQLEPGDAHPGLRELLVGRGHQPRAHALARFQVLGHHDELGIAGVGQLGVERQVEARRAGAGVGGEEAHVLVLRQHRLHALDLLGRRRERRAFLHAQVDDQLGTRAVREELLRHELHAGQRDAPARPTVTPITSQRRSMAKSIQPRSLR